MKYLLAFLSLCCMPVALALPIGNPSDPCFYNNGVLSNCPASSCFCYGDVWSLRLGFYGDYIFNRHFENAHHQSIRRTKITTNAGLIALNICERVDFFGTLGATNIHLVASDSVFSPNVLLDRQVFLDTGTDFSWSVGVRGIIFECYNFLLGGEFQYFSSRPHLNRVISEASPPVYFSQEYRYREWQVGLALSYNRWLCDSGLSFVPYIGVKWCRARFDTNNILFFPVGGTGISLRLPNFRNERDFGYAVGFTIVGCRLWSASVEGRFVDEKAVSVNTQFRY